MNKVWVAVKIVFSRSGYVLLAVVLLFAALALAAWLPNWRLLFQFVSSAGVPASFKLVWALLWGLSSSTSTFSLISTILVSVLFGLSGSMIVYLIRRDSKLSRAPLTAGLAGVAGGVLGVGCAACGSFILSSILASSAAAGALAVLPLEGGEFSILSIVLLVLSLILVSKKISAPLICKPS